MRVLRAAIGAVVMSALSSTALVSQAPAPASCDPAGPVKFVCGQDGPEDLVAVPGTRFLIASAFGGPADCS